MNILKYFSTKCRHENFSADKDIGYCCDCGALIENQWYLVRCGCCGVKLKAKIKNGQIVPYKNYCDNCGAHEFVVERIERINFIDVNYAVLVKQEIENPIEEFTQTWVNTTEDCTPKLLR